MTEQTTDNDMTGGKISPHALRLPICAAGGRHLERHDGIDTVPGVQDAIWRLLKPLTPREIVGGSSDIPGGVGVGPQPGQVGLLKMAVLHESGDPAQADGV